MHARLARLGGSLSSRFAIGCGALSICTLSQAATFAEPSETKLPPAFAEQKAAESNKKRRRVKKRKKVQNPGKVEEFTKTITDVLESQHFQGASFGFNTPLFEEEPPQQGPKNASTNKQVIVGTKVSMGSPSDDGHHSVDFTAISLFHGGQYVLMSQYTLGKDHTSGGRLNGRVICKPRDYPVSALLQMAITPDPNYTNVVLESDYKGSDYTFSSVLMPGMGVLSYAQRMTKTWSAGISGFTQMKGTSVAGSWLNYAVNYSTMKRKTDGEQFVAVLQGNGPFTLGYAHKVDEGLTLASEFQVNPASLESKARMGALYTKKTFMLRANLDSDGRVASSLELATMTGPRFQVSAELKHAEDQANFGVGFSLG